MADRPIGDRKGRVYLVGAGPGDPGLLTARALELIARADTILYDRLIPAQALDGARPDAELLFVGKEGGGESVPQEHTQELLIERARAGCEVVRLKGGDPFVFGRGGEEALALRAAGIEFEVVPGVTAGVAASAYAGIPVTHRGLSTAVALITGHTRDDSSTGDAPASEPSTTRAAPAEPMDGREPEERMDGREPEERMDGREPEERMDGREPELDWPALAAFPGTLVFYMGVRRLPLISKSLIAAGRPADQPAAIVERGTLPDQRTVTATLGTIAQVAREQAVKAPAITIVGDVAGLAGELDWLPARPLAGHTVAVTRARAQASELARRLTELGATVVQTPAIRTRAVSDGAAAPLDPSPYDLICLTSPNAVDYMFESLTAAGRDARSLAGARIAAIGPATARALARYGIAADVVPDSAVAESLVQALGEMEVRRALIPRAREARDVLPDALRERGARVDVVTLYETVPEPLSERVLAAAREADYITFTSSSTVRYFLQAAGSPRQDAPGEQARSGSAALSPTTRIVSIGPVTSETLREHDLEPHVEADRHDIEGLIDALLTDSASLAAPRPANPRPQGSTPT